MPLNKSTTYHQSVQLFVQFFSKKLSVCLSKNNFFFKKNFLNFFLLSFTSNLLSFTTFYSVLPRLVLSFTKYPLGVVSLGIPAHPTQGCNEVVYLATCGPPLTLSPLL